MAKTRNIPTELKYVRRKAVSVSQWWNKTAGQADKQRMVRPTFVVDSINEKTLATAETWAGGYQKDQTAYDITVLPNNPIESVELIDLDRRGRGGRAWKVLIDGAYYVDMREDVLLESLVNGPGVQDGMILGPFIWASAGQGLKLTRMESGDHKRAENLQKLSKATIKKKDLVVGGVYANASDSRYTFLGYADVDHLTEHGNWIERSSYIGAYKHRAMPYNPSFNLKTDKRVQVWSSSPWSTVLNPDSYTKRNLSYYVSFTPNRKVCELVETVDVGDPLVTLRELQLQALREALTGIDLTPVAPGGSSWTNGHLSQVEKDEERLRATVRAWTIATARQPKQPRVIPPELQQLSEHPLLKPLL